MAAEIQEWQVGNLNALLALQPWAEQEEICRLSDMPRPALEMRADAGSVLSSPVGSLITQREEPSEASQSVGEERHKSGFSSMAVPVSFIKGLIGHFPWCGVGEFVEIRPSRAISDDGNLLNAGPAVSMIKLLCMFFGALVTMIAAIY